MNAKEEKSNATARFRVIAAAIFLYNVFMLPTAAVADLKTQGTTFEYASSLWLL